MTVGYERGGIIGLGWGSVMLRRRNVSESRRKVLGEGVLSWGPVPLHNHLGD